MSRRRRFALGLVLVGLTWVLAACQTVATVTIDGEPDGSGLVTVVVELDQEAAAVLGDAEVLTDGLAEAGWDVSSGGGSETGDSGTVDSGNGDAESGDSESETSGPDAGADAGLTLTASKGYVDSDGLAEVLEEIGGSADLFSDTFSEIVEEAVDTTYRVGTTVSVTGDPAQFSDPELTELLDGLPLGRTQDELAFFGMDQPGAGILKLEINVPGEGGSASASFDLTSGVAQSSEVEATGVVEDPSTLRWIILGAALAVVGLVLLAVGLIRARRDRRNGRGSGDSHDSGGSGNGGTGGGAAGPRRRRTIVLPEEPGSEDPQPGQPSPGDLPPEHPPPEDRPPGDRPPGDSLPEE